jgi:hypothetical protein
MTRPNVSSPQAINACSFSPELEEFQSSGSNKGKVSPPNKHYKAVHIFTSQNVIVAKPTCLIVDVDSFGVSYRYVADNCICVSRIIYYEKG